MTRLLTLSVCALFSGAGVAHADTAGRLLQLMSAPGVAGYEAPVRERIEMLLPAGARVRADSLGNILIRTGNGNPHTLIVAPLDEPGFVVSAITDDGYLRVHQHTQAAGVRLNAQFFIGQPVLVHTASGAAVPGVTATPSVHLSAFRDPQIESRIKILDDVWVDVGAESRTAVEKAGIRLLDSVTLRERAMRLAGAQVSGVAAANRAAALALAEIIRRSPGRGAAGSVSFAWVAQSEFGNRGLLRMLETLQPDRLLILRGPQSVGDDPGGATGNLGGGPVVADGDTTFAAGAASARLTVQTAPAARWRFDLPAAQKAIDLHFATVPVRFARTPVETVDARDVDALAALVAGWVGLPPIQEPAADDGPAEGAAAPPASVTAPPLALLKKLAEAHGVAGHEAPVRQAIVEALPSWCKPSVDERGNLVVSFGTGEKELLFVAHMDEVGFEIAAIEEDGSASVSGRGGMYLSLYEAHSMLVHTPSGAVPAILTPRAGYAAAQTAQPSIGSLRLYFGTATAAETKQLGIASGQSASVPKTLLPLGASRATARSMDDRNGSTALLLALARIDPSKVENRVTFAWTVEEETGLGGAVHLARTLAPETAFAIDTFVSSDTPVDGQRLAGARLGKGAVLRALDSRTIVPPHIVDRITAVAGSAGIPLQLGVTSGGTDASAFSAGGAVDVGLSWPGRYSHSPVEVMDVRDLDALARLIAALAAVY